MHQNTSNVYFCLLGHIYDRSFYFMILCTSSCLQWVNIDIKIRKNTISIIKIKTKNRNTKNSRQEQKKKSITHNEKKKNQNITIDSEARQKIELESKHIKIFTLIVFHMISRRRHEYAWKIQGSEWKVHWMQLLHG